MILVIGNLAKWRRDKRALPQLADVRYASVADLGQSLLELRPEMVLSPLFDDDFDALELGQKLHELGFQGRYRALAGPGTAASVVVEDIRQVAPGLDFDLIVVNLPEDGA